MRTFEVSCQKPHAGQTIIGAPIRCADMQAARTWTQNNLDMSGEWTIEEVFYD